ncbi:MAG TPA: DUF72 domain-containing protein [Candidatus Dormibacteraeota bacterium]|nr:DUF72 domain-containing protein [Candidatus Dormibacteraeota bacterium]
MLFVGTSGWQYAHWRRVFYPERLPQRAWLPFFADRFQTVEVNNTFYNLPEKSVFEQWRLNTPADFCFSVKMSRYLTHLKRLHDPQEPVKRFMDRASALGPKLGPVLIQLPPHFHANLELLDATLALFEPSVRVAVEFRDAAWFTPETKAVLEQHHAALCLADTPRRKQPSWRTADWGFVRFHEGTGAEAPGYRRDVLETWVRTIVETWAAHEDVYVYFNNDTGGYAIRDAMTFAELASAAGLSPTRVPATFAA